MIEELHSGNGRAKNDSSIPSKTPENSPSSSSGYLGCPFFALNDDPDTSLLFASSTAYCHKVVSPEPVQLDHQEIHCLTSAYVDCPVFKQDKPGRLPTALLGQDPTNENGSGIWAKILGGLALIAIAILFIGWGSGLLANRANFFEVTATESALAAAVLPTATSTPTTAVSTNLTSTTEVTPTAVATNTAVPTKTSQPTATVTPPASATPMPTAKPTATETPSPAPPPLAIIEAPINLRVGPHISYPVLGRLTEIGGQFEIQTMSENGWWEICCLDGASGWTPADSVGVSGETAVVPIVPPPPPQIMIEVSRLNVRSGPSVDYPVVGTVDYGETLQIIGRLNDESWWEVCCIDEGATGWVFSESITILGEPGKIPIVPVPPLLPSP